MNNITTYQQQITKSFQRSEITFEFFYQFAEDYKRQLENGVILTDRKVKFSQETVRQYKSAIDHFRDFETHLSQPIGIAEMNGAILKVFERYLTGKGLSMNSVSLYISKLKAIANILLERGISYTPCKIKTTKDKSSKVTLSLAELKKMREAQLTNSETVVRDVFMVQAFTGLRYKFLCKFLKNPTAYIKDNEGKNYIDIVSDKNNEQSIIPLHPQVTRLLTKYAGEMPIYSEQYVNKMIKVVANKSGIDQLIPKRMVIGGEMTEELVPKFTVLSSHSARSAFITNLKRFTSNNEAVRMASGHTSDAQLLNYVRSSKLERAQPLFECEFFEKEF